MRLILKAGILMLTLTALPVSAHAGTMDSAPKGATLEGWGDASAPASVRIDVPSARQGPSRKEEVLLSLPSNLSPEAIEALARRHRLTHLESQSVGLLGRTVHRWRIADGRSIADVILALKRDGGIDAQPNNIYSLQ
jgi:hypothetical protein